MANTIGIRTPCCKRMVRPLPNYKTATIVRKRTCPKCSSPWQIVVRPIKLKIAGASAHVLEWLPVGRKSGGAK